MIHTQHTIEEITLDLLQGSLSVIRGGFYHTGERPLNSTAEDCVVGLLTGNGEQVQEGYINVHIYVPQVYTPADGMKHVDKARCQQREQELANITTSLNAGGDVYYSLSAMPKTMTDTTTGETFVSAQYRFKFLTI